MILELAECGSDILQRGRSRSYLIVVIALRPDGELMVAGLSVLSCAAVDKMITDVSVDKKVEVGSDDNFEYDSEGLGDDIDGGGFNA